MKRMGKFKRMSKGQAGFTIAEVFVGSLLMVMASMGLLSLFNSSVQLAGVSRETKDAQQYARQVSERIRSLPFYEPHNYTPRDVDDYFWGTAEQHGGDITTNNWSTNPYVDCTLVTDPRFTCQVKMAYVLDNLATKNMKATWIPSANGAQQGLDKPVSVDNDMFNVIQYEVKVSWKVKPENASASSYSYTTLMTSTQFQANLGVTAVINIDSNSSKWGTGGQFSNTAPHTANSLAIRITGYGFKAGCTAKLMRTGMTDVNVTSLTLVDGNTLTGYVNLDTGGPAAAPWQPRLVPGKWTARVTIGSAFAYGYDAFTVELPRPTISYLNPVTAKDTRSDFAVTAGGNNVLNLGSGSSPYTSYCGATIRLVKDDNPELILTPRSDRAITYGASGGYGVYNTVTANFDFRNTTAGTYYVEIVNCVNNTVPVADGNTISLHSDLYKFTITAAAPTPTDIYVTGSPGSEVYVAPSEKRHFAYRSRNYQYNIRIDGTDLGAVTIVKVGIGGNPVQGTGDWVANATNVLAAADGSYVTATVNLNGVPDGYAEPGGNVYSWWAYCEQANGAKGNVQSKFQVRDPRPILYRDAIYMNGPGGVYHNYAPVGVRLQGECFDSSAYNVKYRSGAYAYGDQSYTVGVSDGSMTKGTPTSYGTVWDTQLNLFRVKTGARNVWVETNDATPITDNGFVSTLEPARTYSFYANVVAAGATLNAQSTGAVTITNRFHDYWTEWFTTKDAWRGPTANTENASTVAKAQRSDTGWFGNQKGYATFTLRGQGFKEAGAGTSWIGVYIKHWSLFEGDHWDGINSGNFTVADAASAAAALTDRGNKYVTINTSEWEMPSDENQGRINLDNSGDGRYLNRFYIQPLLQNN